MYVCMYVCIYGCTPALHKEHLKKDNTKHNHNTSFFIENDLLRYIGDSVLLYFCKSSKLLKVNTHLQVVRQETSSAISL